MKVLFAVSNEAISESIVKKYQQVYKEIIASKNVYYFNAILKELQKDKSYDRIVISEDLEPFTNNNYETIDNFIFEKLDNISDEAVTNAGEDIPIILIATDRRTKSDNLLMKLFGIGVYSSLLGQDRSIDEVCKLIHKPRSKKEAKIYYKIDSSEVEYKPESEENVSETEIQNILTHYKRLGRNEERYVESFDNIAAQYTDEQLKVIIKFLPLNVKAVLEEDSARYQQLVSFGNSKNTKKSISTTKTKRKSSTAKTSSNTGIKIESIPSAEKKLTKPVIIPTANKEKKTKTATTKVVESPKELPQEPEIEEVETAEVLPKEKPKTKTRRKKKEPEPVQEPEETILPGFEEEPSTPQFEPEETTVPQFYEEEEEEMLPGFEQIAESEEEPYSYTEKQETREIESYQKSNANLGNLLSRDKKIVAFVGTSKNGTSFLVNNLAQILANQGIKTAILDLTKNRNAYYIYTKNEEKLREIAYSCNQKLSEGRAEGIKVNSYLDVYTSLPEENNAIEEYEEILETLVRNYSLILLDCDFTTPYHYLEEAQEIYLVQSMDVLTIQPLTAYLRDLKAKGVLNQTKLRVVINKYTKVKGVTKKAIIGGMAFYNDPSMSFMTELFNRETIPYCTIPFDGQVYAKYLEGLINCNISLSGYPKEVIGDLQKLASMVYPLVGNPQINKKAKRK